MYIEYTKEDQLFARTLLRAIGDAVHERFQEVVLQDQFLSVLEKRIEDLKK